jgi:hypothetical protein
MLWRMSADLPDKRIGFMGILFPVILSGAAPQPATNVSAINVFQSAKTGCANCANPCLSSRFPGPYYGTQKFPVAERLSGAISCRVVSEASRFADAWTAKALAEIAETPGWAGRREARLTRGPGVRRFLTPRTPIPRLPALCLSGPFRSELSARSADRGRVVPVLDRSSRRSPIAPFAPSFP